MISDKLTTNAEVAELAYSVTSIQHRNHICWNRNQRFRDTVALYSVAILHHFGKPLPRKRVGILEGITLRSGTPGSIDNILLAREAGASSLRALSVARLAGCYFFHCFTWGSARKASLHPGLYACACFRRLVDIRAGSFVLANS